MSSTKLVLLAVLLIAIALVSETDAQYLYSPYSYYSSYYYPYSSYYGGYYGYGYPYYSAYGWYGKREAGFEPQQQQ